MVADDDAESATAELQLTAATKTKRRFLQSHAFSWFMEIDLWELRATIVIRTKIREKKLISRGWLLLS